MPIKMKQREKCFKIRAKKPYETPEPDYFLFLYHTLFLSLHFQFLSIQISEHSKEAARPKLNYEQPIICRIHSPFASTAIYKSHLQHESLFIKYLTGQPHITQPRFTYNDRCYTQSKGCNCFPSSAASAAFTVFEKSATTEVGFPTKSSCANGIK